MEDTNIGKTFEWNGRIVEIMFFDDSPQYAYACKFTDEDPENGNGNYLYFSKEKIAEMLG